MSELPENRPLNELDILNFAGKNYIIINVINVSILSTVGICV